MSRSVVAVLAVCQACWLLCGSKVSNGSTPDDDGITIAASGGTGARRRLKITTGDCNVPDLSKVKSAFDKASFTRRGIDELMRFMAPVFTFDQYPRDGKGTTIYEVGCGMGRALMEVQSALPAAKVLCTNRRSYHNEQSTTTLGLLNVATHYEIPIKCREDKVPIVPTIRLDDGIQNWGGRAPFPTESVDIVYGIHSLNQGKIYPFHSRDILPLFVPLLKERGFISVMLLYNCASVIFDGYRPNDDKDDDLHKFNVMKILPKVEVPGGRGTYTIMLYERRNSIGLYVQRCRNGEARMHAFWGCIRAPVTNAKAYRPMTVFKEVLAVYTDFLAKLPKPLPVGVSKRLGVSRAADKKYGTDYMANINEFLERVVDSPERLLTP